MVEADPVTPIGRAWKKHFESVCRQTSWLESLVSLNNSRARVAIGGGADTGAGKVFYFFATQMYVSEFQVEVRDHEEVEVLQKDLGSG